MARVLIGIPIRHIYGTVAPKTQACIDRLRATTPNATELRMVRGQQISQNSFTLCRQFLDEGWDYLLYTGDDIIFPPWALDRLLAHDKDFVSGVCTWKTPPYFVPVGMQGADGKFRHILIRPEHVKNNVLLEVDGTGSGFILVKRKVIERVWDYLSHEVFPAIPKKYRWLSPIPFFPAVRDPETGDVFSSDFAFARLAKESGSRIFLDCGLICRHRWEGEYDITSHWAWLDKYGFTKEEEQYYGHEVKFSPVDENSIYWGEAGPPVPITICTTGNQYHTEAHIWPTLGCMYESILEQKAPRTNVGYMIGWHVQDDAGWQVYSNWASRYKRVLIHWVGSDLDNINSWLTPERLVHMNRPEFIHIVEDERLVPEAKHYFEKVNVCPLPTTNIFPVMPLPEKFAVAVYYPEHRHDFHYGDVLVETMKKMPDVTFFLYHLFGKKPAFELPNMVWLGNLSPQGYGELLANTSCMLRLSKHDGRPYSIVEAGVAGRRFVTNFDMPFTHRVPDVPTADDVVTELKKLQEMREPDYKASRSYLRENDLHLYKARIRKLAGIPEAKDVVNDYDYAKFWEGRFDGTDATFFIDAQKDSAVNDFVMKAVKTGKFSSLLDVGCGTAERWEELPMRDYTGVDVSPTAIRKASERHKDGKFFVADISRDPLPPADLVIALHVLNHIRPSEFDDVLKKLLGATRKELIAVISYSEDRKRYQFNLPPIELWELEGWRGQLFDITGSENSKMVVLTKRVEAHEQSGADRRDTVLQSA